MAETGLQRRLGLLPLISIVVANIVGSGIFVTSGLLMADLRNPLLMVALWAAGGLIALCGAFCYSELGAAIPEAGGEYTFLSRLYHPLLGFLSGWVSFFVGFSAPIAASAIGFSEYLTRAFPGLLAWGGGDGELTVTLVKKGLAVLTILVFTLIHLRGIVFGSRVQNLLTVLKVGLIVALIGLGFALGSGDLGHLEQGEPFDFDFGGAKSIGLALMWIMFSYSGWNASAYIGSEIRNPKRNLPYSLIFGTGVVVVLYLALNLLYLYAIPPRDMYGVISVGGLAAGNLFGARFESIFSILIAFSLFSSLSAFIIIGPRVYYQMARDGRFFDFAAEVHDRRRVPSKSIILQCIIASVIVVSGTFDQILTYMGFSLGIFPILAVAGVFRLRRAGNTPYRMPAYPLAPILYLVAGGSILALGFLERPLPSTIALLTVAAGVPAYFVFTRRNRGASNRST
jgi:APA family basic amino acid/polyamine antiporter